jgi:hypothetical protein
MMMAMMMRMVVMTVATIMVVMMLMEMMSATASATGIYLASRDAVVARFSKFRISLTKSKFC